MNMNKIVAQFKRELWENRSSFLWSPLIFGILFFVIAVWLVSEKNFREGGMQWINRVDPDGIVMIVSFYLASCWALQMIVFAVVVVVYTHSTLFSDRKNREILFWRSMPVSETVNVLTKLAIVCIVIPLIVCAANLIGGFLFVVFLGVISSDFGDVWPALGSLTLSVRLLGKSFMIVLLILPIIAWCLFCSAYARRSPVTISLSVPLGASIVDAIAKKYFGVNLYFNDALMIYIQPARNLFKKIISDSGHSAPDIHLIPNVDLQMTSMVLLFSVLMISAAIWLRNNRYEI